MNKALWIFSFLLLSCLSYLREILFLSINAVIAGKNDFYAKTIKIEFFLNNSEASLTQYKYILTVTFTLLFSLLTIYALKSIFKSKVPFYISSLLYFIAATTGILIILYSTVIGNFDSTYSFLRLIIEYIHNPLIFIFVSVAGLSDSLLSNNNLR